MQILPDRILNSATNSYDYKLRKSYIIGDDVLAQTAGSIESSNPASTQLRTDYLLYDGHGSTRQLIGTVDNSRTAEFSNLRISTYDFDAYGIELPQTATSQAKPQANSEETNLRYSGEFFDKDLNQQYLRARYYNQNNGQFNRLDPYSGNLSDPQSLHKYAYCHQDPVNLIDPSGNFSLAEITVVTTIIGTLSGLSLGAYYGGLWGALQGAITGFLLGLFIGEMIGLTLATGIYLLGGYCGVTIFGGGLFVDASLALGSGTTLYAGALEGTTTQIIANKFKNMFSRFTSIYPRSRVRVTVNNTTASSNNSARSGVNESNSAIGNSGATKSGMNTPLNKHISGIADDTIVHFGPQKYSTVKPGAGGDIFNFRYGDIKMKTPRQIETLIGNNALSGVKGGSKYMHVIDDVLSNAVKQPGGVVYEVPEFVLRGSRKALNIIKVE